MRQLRNDKRVFLTKIYTKSGDAGETSLGNGQRLPKNDPRIEILGIVDELNSLLGIVRARPLPNETDRKIERVQRELFGLGADLSSAKKDEVRTEWVERLESEIDALEKNLPPLREFILPGGSVASAHLHFARTVCRRAERRLAPLVARGEANSTILVYLNRLSDWLFVLARHVCRETGGSETTWIPDR
ncbi:MAG: cob(I)yrinic acid a,c-diamide adenosyltransferase [Pseudomonadota bacterium]